MLMIVRYAHTLLFTCPYCNRPVGVTRVSDDKNLEALEQQQFQLTCLNCQTNFSRPGCLAKERSVQQFNGAVQT